jgi:hypothetical protein
VGEERVGRKAGSGLIGMARLLIHVEGQTEEDFVNEVLRHHLVTKATIPWTLELWAMLA